MFAGAAKLAPFAGAVMLTVGGTLTVMATGAEVAITPETSVTIAVLV